jgi:ectoine hydroxylase-related dioxygenase (phytanoyl-CoA dioxygenase family)
MRRLTDELVWGTDIKVDKTYETIRVLKKDGEIEERQTLTRLENFVKHHERWRDLCCGYICGVVSAISGTEMVLFKENLNLKPPGGSGFAPHLDTPSLRVALGESGPQTFVTVMVAIDNMTAQNGCLRIAKGTWSEDNRCELVTPVQAGNPNGGGQAGGDPSGRCRVF